MSPWDALSRLANQVRALRRVSREATACTLNASVHPEPDLPGQVNVVIHAEIRPVMTHYWHATWKVRVTSGGRRLQPAWSAEHVQTGIGEMDDQFNVWFGDPADDFTMDVWVKFRDGGREHRTWLLSA